MENQVNDQSGNLIEEFSDDFQCCVCLDIFYKPVVLACGHIACFWCVFKAMDFCQESHCPVCRNTYNHFPSICWLLNFVLLKLYPSAYKQREIQITEQEKKSGNFSPEFENYLSHSHFNKELDILCSSSLYSTAVSQSQSCLTSSMEEGEPSSVKDSSVAISADKDFTNIPPNSSCEASGSADKDFSNMPVPGSCEQVRIADLLCGLCKQLLYRPLVLNCGHVYCESCIINPSNKTCKCQACQCVHPNGFPKVCLVLEHFLEDQFSKEYAARRLAVLNQRSSQHGSPLICSTEAQENCSERPQSPITDHSSLRWRQGPRVHVGVGCDHCGMCPIIGKRYRCKDCVEKLGFDLCQGCYDNRSSNLPGRFNQQHKLEHNANTLYESEDGDEQIDSESAPPISPNYDGIESYEEIPPETTQYYETEIARLRQELVDREIRHQQEIDNIRAEVGLRRRQFNSMMRAAGLPVPDDDSPTSST